VKQTFQFTAENDKFAFVHAAERRKFEFVIVCKSGNVYLYNSIDAYHELIGRLDFPILYSEEYFAYSKQIGHEKSYLQINTYGNYVCITQRFGQHGVVLNFQDKKFKKSLIRGNYYVEHCTFPIAFYSSADSTFLIHGTDWNRLDITNLERDELLTKRTVEYKTDSNYFDYFHSSLCVSPNEKYFASNGWVWGPYDVITVYSIDEFLSRYELAHTSINLDPVDGYNWDRPMCWLDAVTIGVAYNKKEDGEHPGDFPSEIVLVDIPTNEITDRIEFDGFKLSEDGAPEGELFFDQASDIFISPSGVQGALISDRQGNKQSVLQEVLGYKYSAKHRFFYKYEESTQSIVCIEHLLGEAS
jgi:hypothetical protein